MVRVEVELEGAPRGELESPADGTSVAADQRMDAAEAGPVVEGAGQQAGQVTPVSP